jgi:hypothetical protein
MKLEKPKEVFSPDNLIYNKILHFFTGVTVEEKQRSDLTPFFQQFDQFSWRTVPDFWGFVAFFWPRWLNSTS